MENAAPVLRRADFVASQKPADEEEHDASNGVSLRETIVLKSDLAASDARLRKLTTGFAVRRGDDAARRGRRRDRAAARGRRDHAAARAWRKDRNRPGGQIAGIDWRQNPALLRREHIRSRGERALDGRAGWDRGLRDRRRLDAGGNCHGGLRGRRRSR